MIIILYVSKGVYEQCNGNLSDALLCFNNSLHACHTDITAKKLYHNPLQPVNTATNIVA